jgi:hypothetical protein
VPTAAFCRVCREYVWVIDGGCSEGHPISQLQGLYEAPAASGVFVPPPSRPPQGAKVPERRQIDLLPQPTYGPKRS